MLAVVVLAYTVKEVAGLLVAGATVIQEQTLAVKAVPVALMVEWGVVHLLLVGQVARTVAVEAAKAETAALHART